MPVETKRESCARRTNLLVFAFVVLLFLVWPKPGEAQTTYGTIFGTVTDNSGGVIPDAPVVLTDIDTGDVRQAATNADGLYRFVNVPPARYRIECDVKGFKRLIRSPLVLQTQTTIEVNLGLQVGSVSQTVHVSSETPLLQPATSSLGQVIDERETDQLPLNGRNPMSLTALVPSVVPQGGSQQTPTGENPFGWGNYQMGGGMANQSITYLDGAPVNTAYDNMTALIPTQDSLGGFKVLTNAFSPEYGGSAGGVVSFTTKSGTNELHGNAWEYLRNKVLDANTYFGNNAGLARPPFTQNQFGFNLGGPVYIPHFYNGHNKMFFFVDWEGFRLRQGTTYTETVPTVAERSGDFSALSSTIYNPLTTCGDTSPVSPACGKGETQYDRTAFPNNTIPKNLLNPVALALLAYYPLPNTNGTSLVNNYTTNATSGGNNDETVVHIDYNYSPKQHISGRYTYWTNYNLPIDPNHNGICDGQCAEHYNTNNFVLGDTYSFSPTTILDVHLSYQRFSYLRTPSTLGFNLTSIGQPASLNTEAQYKAVPEFCLDGYDTAGIYCSQGQGSYISDYNDNDRIAADLTKFVGRHTLTFG